MKLTTDMTVDASSHFDVFGRRGLTTTPVHVSILPEMYAPAKEPRHHWLYLSFTGFRVLARRLVESDLSCEIFASIGTSSGLDAIGAVEAFNPGQVIVTDVLSSVVPIALENVKANCANTKPTVRGLCGSLVEPLQREGVRADIIYENLPNLPSPIDADSLYSEGATAASFYPILDSEQAKLGEGTFLELHESFLQKARSVLRPNGSVICAIGGRVEWRKIHELFLRNRYYSEILTYLLKPQEQANECLPVYAAAEGSHAFSFYPFERACKLMDDCGHSGINDEVVPESTIEKIERLLLPLKISASEAMRLSQRGEMVGHLAYLIRGIPID